MLGRLLSTRILRFAAVGICNAAISFGLLNLAYYKGGFSKIVSSIISTTCALLFSFVMNRGFVFGDKSRTARQQLPAFVAVTITGSLLVLNLVYALSVHLLEGNEHILIDPIKNLTGIVFSKSFIDINVSTVIGAAVALFWNYNGYRWFVFKGETHPYAVEEAIEHTP